MDNSINYTPVGGEELSAIGYDDITKTLYVRRGDGKTVIHYDVPVISNVALLSAESIEAHYNERIKDVYRSREV